MNGPKQIESRRLSGAPPAAQADNRGQYDGGHDLEHPGRTEHPVAIPAPDRDARGRLYELMAAGAVPFWALLDICGSEANMPHSTAAISACARLVAPSFWYSLAT
jgi:hypothetical protein